MAITLQDGVEGKVCSKCKGWKPLERFSRKQASPDGYNWLCKPCNAPKPHRGLPIVPEGKACTRCHVWKPIEEYHTKRGAFGGHRAACKACTNAANKARADSNRDAERERQRVYYAEHRAAIRAKRALYAAHSRETIRAWHRRNREKMREYQREYRRRRPEVSKNALRKWEAANKDKRLSYYHRRRALKAAAPGRFTAAEWRALKEYHRLTCLRGGRRGPEIRLTPDHVVPLSRGGGNGIENIQPLCRACNCGKGAQVIDYR